MKKSRNGVGLSDWQDGRVMNSRAPENLEGRLLTLVESLGLAPTQEHAVKNLVSQALWQWVYDFTEWLDEKEHIEVRRKVAERKKREPIPPHIA